MRLPAIVVLLLSISLIVVTIFADPAAHSSLSGLVMEWLSSLSANVQTIFQEVIE